MRRIGRRVMNGGTSHSRKFLLITVAEHGKMTAGHSFTAKNTASSRNANSSTPNLDSKARTREFTLSLLRTNAIGTLQLTAPYADLRKY
jgi:hypothetical protein